MAEFVEHDLRCGGPTHEFRRDVLPRDPHGLGRRSPHPSEEEVHNVVGQEIPFPIDPDDEEGLPLPMEIDDDPGADWNQTNMEILLQEHIDDLMYVVDDSLTMDENIAAYNEHQAAVLFYRNQTPRTPALIQDELDRRRAVQEEEEQTMYENEDWLPTLPQTFSRRLLLYCSVAWMSMIYFFNRFGRRQTYPGPDSDDDDVWMAEGEETTQPSDPFTTEEAGPSQNVERSDQTVLVENRGGTLASPGPSVTQPPSDIAFTDPPTTFPHFLDRWNNIGTFLWTTAHATDKIIESYDFPRDALTELANNPTLLPLEQYLYFRPHMTIRFQINSTKFHQGMLIFGVKYYSSTDAADQRTPTMASQLFQMDYATVQAASSSTVTIEIPFASFLDLIPIRNGLVGSSCYYASVFVGVVSALQVGPNSSNSVTVTTQVKFSTESHKTELFGQISRMPVFTAEGLLDHIPGASTFGTVVNKAEALFKGLGSIYKSLNEDKPIEPKEACPVLDYPTVSYSNGEGVTQAKILRLSPNTLTPHKPGTVPTSFSRLSAEDLCQKWGIIGRFNVTEAMEANAPLWENSLTPLSGLTVTGSELYLPTPTAGVAGLYTYWSGELEYKFIVVKSDPHSLRLRISISPMSILDSKDLINVQSLVQDFEEQTEIDFTAPFLAPVKMIPTEFEGRLVGAGILQVRLESKLITMESVANNVEVIVLCRAPNLQLAVPRNSVFTPNVFTDYKKDIKISFINPRTSLVSEAVYADSSRDTVYIPSNSRELRTYPGVKNLFIGQTICHSKPPKWNDKFEKYLVGIALSAFKNMSTIQPPKEEWATAFVKVDGQSHEVRALLREQVPTGGILITYTLQDVPKLTTFGKPIICEAEGEDERHQAPNPQDTHLTRQIANYPEILLGERFPLQAALKRYQTIASGNFSTDSRNFTKAVMIYDVNYGSIAQREQSRPVDNLTFVHDGFRFGKGSLNYIFNVTTQVNESGNVIPLKVQVTHIPTGLSGDPEPGPAFTVVPTVTSSYTPGTVLAHELVSAGTTVIPYNVPYYSYVNYLVNGYDPTANGIASRAAYAFGQVQIEINLPPQAKFDWELKRSLGDDADLYCFQGWPLCKFRFQDLNVNTQEPIKVIKSRKALRKEEEKNLFTAEGEDEKPDHVDGKEDKIPAKVLTMLELAELTLPPGPRRRAIIRKLVKKSRKLSNKMVLAEADDQEELTPRQLEEVKTLFEALVKRYLEKTPMTTWTDFTRTLVDLNDRESLSIPVENNDDHVTAKAACLHVVGTIAQRYKNCPMTFYEATKTSIPAGGFLGNLRNVYGTVTSYLGSKILNVISCLTPAVTGSATIIKTLLDALHTVLRDPMVLMDIVRDLSECFLASDMWVKALALMHLLMKFGYLNFKGLAVCSTLVWILYRCRPARRGYVYMYAEGEGFIDDDLRKHMAQWCAALMGGVSAAFGFMAAKDFPTAIDRLVTNFSRTTNGWYKMLTDSCTFVMDYIVYLLGYDRPDLTGLTELKDNPVDLVNWSERVLTLTNPEQRDKVLSNPKLRAEVGDLYDQGGRVIRLIVSSPDPPKTTAAFYNLWKMLSDLYQEIGMVSTTIAANTAPICIWLHGKPGIGKSELAKHYALAIAKRLGITYEGDPFYVRHPRRYWDGYTAQPILIYDDALQVKTSEAHETFVSDWFSLMTNAPFSPEFAGIVEKKKFVKPQIVIVCSNIRTPTAVQGISDVEAFCRRRDVLIEVSLSPDFVAQFPGIKFASDPRVIQQNYDLSTFQHLRFGHYADTVSAQAQPSVTVPFEESCKLTGDTAERLSKQRLALAKRAVEASSCLSVETISATRASLVADITSTDTQQASTSTATSIVNAIAQTVQAEGEETYADVIGPTIIKDRIDAEEDCLYGCEDLHKVVLCHCRIKKQTGEYHICYKHGHILYQPRVKGRGARALLLGRVTPPISDGNSVCCTASQYNKARFDNVVACNAQHERALGLAYTPIRFTDEAKLESAPQAIPKSIKKLSEYITSRIKSIWDYIPIKFLVLLVVGAGIGFLIESLHIINGLKKLYTKVFGSKGDDSVEADLASSGSVHTFRQNHTRLVASAEGSIYDEIPRVQRNMFDITVQWSNGRSFTMGGFWLKGRVGVTPAHLWAPPQNGVQLATVRFVLGTRTARKVEVELPASEVQVTRVHVPGDEHPMDLSVVKVLSKKIPLNPDMTKSLSDSKGVSRLTHSGTIVARDGMDRFVDYKAVTKVVHYQNIFGGLASQIRGYMYDQRAKGMCGSILLDNKGSKILGLHVAGSGENGYAIRLLMDDLAVYLSDELSALPVSLAEGDSVEAEGDILPLGRVDKELAMNSPLKSKIVRSECFGILTDPVRQPVKFITPNEPVPGLTNLRVGIEKMAHPTKAWPSDTFKKVVEWRKEKILATQPVLQRIGTLDMQTALFGVPGNQYYPPLKLNTSSGFPLSGGNKPSAKHHYVEYELTPEGYVLKGLKPQLQELYDDELETRKNGVVPFSPYSVFMKDERLKPGKAPRLIEGCPFQQTILFRQYTLDFFAAYTQNSDKLGHAIGINVHGPQWSQLARVLEEKSDMVLCGDYSGFGPGLDTSLILAFGDSINCWYELHSTDRTDLAEANLIRKTLFESLAFSQILAKDTVYQTLCGSPSGNPATVQINSEVNNMMLGCAWLEMFRGTTLADLSYFDSMVTVRVYGDDLIAAVYPPIIGYFNNVTLQETFARFGIKYTDADKTGDVRRYCSLKEASFLKCQFLPHPVRGEGFYLAGLEKPMIEDIVNWIHLPCDSRREATKENCIAACDLAYGHGPEYFEHIKRELTNYWLAKGEDLQVRSWDYLDSLFYGELLDLDVTGVIDQPSWA